MITFGTDGWRGVISEDYTFQNVRLVSEAIAGYVAGLGEKEKGIVVGYDARFLGRQYAEQVAAVIANKGVRVWLSDGVLTTPALTWQVKDRQASGGVMVTASHNPPEYNGLKFKAPYGGSASPEIMNAILQYVRPLETGSAVFPPQSLPTTVTVFSARDSYLDHVAGMLDKEVLSGFGATVVFDVMHGAAMGYTTALAQRYGLDLVEIRNEYNPAFGGVNPEPIDKNLAALREAVREQRAVLGLATDGDGDRIGAMDADGRFITSNQIFALLTRYLVEKRGQRGGVALTVTVSSLVKRVAEKYGLTIYETPVGFKYIANLMLTEDILIGGEESGGIGIKGYIPERDGVMLGYLLIEMCAAYDKTLGELLAETMREVGTFVYRREDLHIEDHRKQRLMDHLIKNEPAEVAGYSIQSRDCRDGCKLYLKDCDGWMMFRASGTEPIVRIYVEAASSEQTDEIMAKAVDYAEKYE